MSNPFFKFKQFTVFHDRCAMKVTTDACLFGAWCAYQIGNRGWRMENALDIGTGTGLLSLMIAQKNDIVIDSVEINKNAAEQASENVLKSEFSEKINVVHADILKWTKDNYEIIISNPPFYESELKSPIAERNIAHHSHKLIWSELFSIIKKKLASEGVFFLLLPFKRIKEAEILLRNNDLFIHQYVIVSQSVQHDPFRVLLMGSNKKANINQQEIAIKNEHNEYTSEFIGLLKDYYLYL